MSYLITRIVERSTEYLQALVSRPTEEGTSPETFPEPFPETFWYRDPKTITALAVGALTLGGVLYARHITQPPQLAQIELRTEPVDADEDLALTELECRHQQLTASPNVSQYLELVRLNLSNNHLVKPPDVSRNLQLIYLDLSENPLTETPDVSRNHRLTHLLLHRCKLTLPPDVSHNPLLKQLCLSENKLTQAPDVSKNLHLALLDLRHNRLTKLPDSILFLPDYCEVKTEDNHFIPRYEYIFKGMLEDHLKKRPSKNGPKIYWDIAVSQQSFTKIDLSSRKLTLPPDVSQEFYLINLQLADNLLTVAPDLSKNPRLWHLNLSFNRLTRAPDVSHNAQLEELNLRHNCLTCLPDSLLSLSAKCKVWVEGNLFSPEYIQTFHRKLQQHRRSHPDQGPQISWGQIVVASCPRRLRKYEIPPPAHLI